MTKSSSFHISQFTPYLLSLAAETAGQEFQRYYKGKYGMLRAEWRVVFHLGQYGPMHAREISERSKTHKTKISRAVAALKKKRYITIEQESKDRRFQLLELTQTGEFVFQDLRNEAQNFDEKLTSALSKSEIDILNKCLSQIAQI